MDADDPLNLSPEELAAEARDQQIRDAIGQINGANKMPYEPPAVGIPADELEYWASLGNITKVKLALRGGKDVNARGENGYTALHGAAGNGYLDIVKLLVLQGADVHAKLDSGESVMELAELAGQTGVVDFLKSLDDD